MIMNICIGVISLILSVRRVETIVTPEEWNQRIEDLINRGLMNADITSASNRLMDLTRTSDCLITFVESHMQQLPSRIAIFLPETSEPIISTLYLSKLQEVRPALLSIGDLALSSDDHGALDALLILETPSELVNLTIDLMDLCGRDCKYGVVIANVLSDENGFMEEANNFVELLWIKRIARVVILGTVGEELLAAQSQSFRANESLRPTEPILIGRCSNNKWVNKAQVFPVMKMNSTQIHFSIVDHQPYANITRKNGTIVGFNGIESFIVKLLAKHLEFEAIPSAVEWGEKTTIEDEILDEFNSSALTDFIIGGLYWTKMNGTEFTIPYDMVRIVWLVPIKEHLSLLGLISPLKPRIWYLSIASLIFGGILKYYLFKKMSFLEIFALVMGFSWPRQPTMLAYRIKFISWVFFGFILTQVYLASLAGQLLAHNERQIDTMRELLNSDLAFGGTASHRNLFNFPGDESEEMIPTIIRNLHSKFVVFEHDEYPVKFQDLIHGRNTSLALIVVLNISNIGKNIYEHKCHRLKQSLASLPLAFAARKGAPYLTQIDTVLGKLIQAGIIRWIAGRKAHIERIRHIEEVEEEDVNLELDDIAPGFLLLIMGYFAGAVCLLGELATNWWFNRKQPKKLRKIEMDKLRKAKRKMAEFDVRKLRGKEAVYLRKRVLRPNVTIGYYDQNGVAWKIV